VTESAELAPIREAVRALCADFPGEYWRALDRERAYPDKFVAALTKAGFLAALIPEEYGGSGLNMAAARRHHGRNPGNPAATARRAMRRCTRWAPCCGTAAPNRKRATCRVSRAANCACKRSASPSRHRAPTTLSLRTTAVRDGGHYVINGQKIWTSRAEYSDLMLLLARTTPREQAGQAHRGAVGLSRRYARGQRQRPDHPPIRTMMNHATHRSVLREHARAGRQPDRRGRARGFATFFPA